MLTIDFLSMDPESTETRPRLVPRGAIRHRVLPHPVLRTASRLFPRTVHRLEVVHLEERMANRNRHFARPRDGWDRGSTEHFSRRIRSQLLQSLPGPIGIAICFGFGFLYYIFRRRAMVLY